MLLYRLFLWIYPFLAKCISPLNEKAKNWVTGQRFVWSEIEALSMKKKGAVIWVHCASYGEFEQGLPFIEALKIKYPDDQIWLTFFSPSGYLHRKNDPAVDFVSYLPFDGPESAKRFIECIQPKLIVFVKYEYWYYYLNIAAEKQIPTVLLSAIFRPDQIIFKWYGDFYRKMVALFSVIFVQDERSYQLITPMLPNTPIVLTGDTRFDRVVANAKNPINIDWIKKLSKDPLLVAGSTWALDHLVLEKIKQNQHSLNWIIVPHHVDKKSIEQCQAILPRAITLTKFLKSTEIRTNNIILIIDQIGLLRNLYQYADIAYIGGGFGKEGVHNVLEAAVYGKPVIWGPNDQKYPEAIGLRKAGGGFSFKNAYQMSDVINQLLEDTSFRNKVGVKSKEFVASQTGATTLAIEYIHENLL